jgi:hypothetical protein
MEASKKFNFLVCLALVLGTVVALTGCPTMIPATDTTPPTISLLISGPGIGTKNLSNPPRARWAAEDGTQYFDLRSGAQYSFTLIVSDEGGVRRANLRVPVDFVVSDLSPSEVRNEEGFIQRSLTVFGNRAEPLTGLTISGKFTPSVLPGQQALFVDFQVEADDFGGPSGVAPNQTFMSVSTRVKVGGP